MKCQYCKAKFTNENAYQIHLGIGAPEFHTCLEANEMQTKGMTQDQNETWSIDESLIYKHQGWATLKSGWAPGALPQEKEKGQSR